MGTLADVSRHRRSSSEAAVAVGDAHHAAIGQKHALKYGEYQPLGGLCSILARKFNKKGVKALLKSAADCEHGLGFSTACIPTGRSP